MANFDHALRLKPDFAQPRANRARSLAETGDIQGALEQYGRARATVPELEAALLG
jgi:hypothetical protein